MCSSIAASADNLFGSVAGLWITGLKDGEDGDTERTYRRTGREGRSRHRSGARGRTRGRALAGARIAGIDIAARVSMILDVAPATHEASNPRRSGPRRAHRDSATQMQLELGRAPRPPR